jgi:hypothetical protein
MTMLVADVLEKKARRNAHHLCVLKLNLLRNYISKGDAVARGYSALLESLAIRSPEEIAEKGTAFYRKQVHSSYYDAVHNPVDFPRTLNFMLRTAFDAFFDWLPDGFSLVFTPHEESNIALPKLGIRFPSNGQPVTVCRVNKDEVEFRSPERITRVQFDDIPTDLRIKKIAIPNSEEAQLVMVKDSSLFQPEYLQRLAPDTDKADSLSRLIGESLGLINAMAPELTSRFTNFVKWFLPINPLNSIARYSFSVKHLSGVIFLSVEFHDFHLAESMVHELHHNELYLLQESELLFKVYKQDLFYSPFRAEPRPLNGLFHALFVFSGVADFIARLENAPTLKAYRDCIRLRRLEVVRQLRIGLAQVQRERLTDLGGDIIDSVETITQQHEKEFGSITTELPDLLVGHLAAWRRANPQFADIIRIPGELGQHESG